MANILIAAPTWTQADPRYATVTAHGGSFLPQLPVSNILGTSLLSIARTTDLAPASTQLVVDLGAPRPIAVVALPWIRGVRTADGSIGGDLDLVARCRVLDGPDPGTAGVVADSGDIAQYPVVYPSWPVPTLSADDPRLVDGRMTVEEAETAEWRQPLLWILPATEVGRYIHVELTSTAVDLAHLDLPPLIVAPGYQPSINADYGLQLQVEDLTEVQDLRGGGQAFDSGPKRRGVRFRLGHIPVTEGLAQLFERVWRLGVEVPVFVVVDPADIVNRHRFAFWGRLRSLGGLDFHAYGRSRMDFEIWEILE